MKAITILRAVFCGAACALLLAACGGGGGSAPIAIDARVTGTEVPASATSSSGGAVAFVKTVAATRDDTAEPVRVGDAVLATSDTDEPDPGV